MIQCVHSRSCLPHISVTDISQRGRLGDIHSKKIWPLLRAYLLILLCLAVGIILFVVLLSVLGFILNLTTSLMLMTLLSIPITYFMVSWSLHNQCIVLGNLRAIAAFRRSRSGNW